MVCAACGRDNVEGIARCAFCGVELRRPLAPVAAAPPPIAYAPPRRTSAAAFASLICAIVSPLTYGVSAIPGLVLGILARREIRRSGGATQGSGLALAGIIVSAVVIVLGIALVVVTAVFAKWIEEVMRPLSQ